MASLGWPVMCPNGIPLFVFGVKRVRTWWFFFWRKREKKKIKPLFLSDEKMQGHAQILETPDLIAQTHKIAGFSSPPETVVGN